MTRQSERRWAACHLIVAFLLALWFFILLLVDIRLWPTAIASLVAAGINCYLAGRCLRRSRTLT